MTNETLITHVDNFSSRNSAGKAVSGMQIRCPKSAMLIAVLLFAVCFISNAQINAFAIKYGHNRGSNLTGTVKPLKPELISKLYNLQTDDLLKLFPDSVRKNPPAGEEEALETSLEAEMFLNNRIITDYTAKYKNQIDALKAIDLTAFNSPDEINKFKKPIEKSIAELKSILDSLNNQTNVINSQIFLYNHRTISPLLLFDPNLDVSTVVHSVFGDKQFTVFENLSTQIGNTTFINTELVSALFGKFRFGLSAFIKATGDTTKDKIQTADIQKMLSAGSSFNVNILTPLFLRRSRNDNSHFGIYLQANLGFSPLDSGGFTQTFNRFKFISHEGMTLRYDSWGSFISDDLRDAMLFVEVPVSYYWGSQDYLQALSLTDFSAIQLSAGIMFKNSVAIKVSGPLYSTTKSVQSSPWTLSIQVSPSNLF